ncbi:putative cyclin-dependent serine/threonine-protein kinase DDB_G0272797/DDB_G0274007 [Oppia nitens]|uniref:putative cyclin-dependent serine/threonine-protein kinase DDB_G0272797/DDB_G0274007 n=1 Tax=Oppia nitens TaxID=1686743 RepID=UPI0023DAA19A|nr:putative cyclin-dependent serine/threonine-protein kinase DDB_G0272797/DDB_G0274007 [Oppia nitens]
MTIDYYQILGISPTNDPQAIRKAYKQLALRYHPDKNQTEGAEEQFKQILKVNEKLFQRAVSNLTRSRTRGTGSSSQAKPPTPKQQQRRSPKKRQQQHRSPKPQYWSPKQQQRSPKPQYWSPKQQRRSPKPQYWSPKQKRRSPKPQYWSPKQQEEGSPKQQRSPKPQYWSPKQKRRSPKPQYWSPKQQEEGSPKPQYWSPKQHRRSPKQQRTPKPQYWSPKQQRRSPKPEYWSPKQQQRSPKHQQMSPKPQYWSPKQKQRSPKQQEEGSPKQQRPTITPTTKTSTLNNIYVRIYVSADELIAGTVKQVTYKRTVSRKNVMMVDTVATLTVQPRTVAGSLVTLAGLGHQSVTAAAAPGDLIFIIKKSLSSSSSSSAESHNYFDSQQFDGRRQQLFKYVYVTFEEVDTGARKQVNYQRWLYNTRQYPPISSNNNQPKLVDAVITVTIPTGCQSGTTITCPGAGHQTSDADSGSLVGDLSCVVIHIRPPQP